MSMTLMARAMTIKTGNPIRKLVLIKLADNANDNGECWPSYQHIADHCECSRSAVRTHIDALIGMGVLTKENRMGINNGKGNTSNVYYLNLDNPVPPKSTAPVPSKITGMPLENTPPMPCGGTRTSHSFEPVNEPNDPPNPQKGEGDEWILADAKKALEFYNEQTGTRCRDVKPFVLMLTPTQTREAYTLAELQLVIRWVLATWRRRGSGLPKPANICRVNRFDGYLADAEAWATTEADIDPDAVMNGYNEIFADTLPAAELDTDRRRMIIRLAAHMKNKTTGAFLGYFEKFRADAPDFYFGSNGGWRASFDYLMKPETLRNTREGSL
ncbi:helix-turn-helix domain-containing protein [Salmonella enterica subsp. enterica serovar Chailey]|uniref:Helix-turn-helix domain-containing protein n=1 Tax=Salmonella enterica subsp. enterica serovar Cerro TaxID=340188 RepID=A0A5W9F561_SALET|nr:helix-turn-helix domain-containing protein [Citrobacter freundii]EBS5848604.1 helix-turn-helix domain-containing protein [Salmonella enterica subsp. enterica serovar Cerro]ECI0424544.1 helix-turn-helix domain-containing protein [Salmonella enterica subsp. enterica]EDR8507143.1 helix-turn-helix domain-containing protein [Salmonella enterica]ELP2122967.1 helix-turn-helix domain-containing protein [Salmonella enterica subsp. enterica serovar Chailey]HBC6265653.1 helix-turn-helix domain-contain